MTFKKNLKFRNCEPADAIRLKKPPVEFNVEF